MVTRSDCKEKLYEAYVSTGQGFHDLSAQTVEIGHRAPAIQRLVSRHFPVNTDAAIVDFGCGYGAHLYVLKQLGYTNLSGIDVSPEMVSIANKLGAPNVSQGDLVSSIKAMATESIDVAMFIDVLEHMTLPELFEILGEAKRVLKPKGKLIVHLPNAGAIFGSTIRYGDLTHETAFTSSSWRQLSEAIGFKDAASFEDRPAPHGIKSMVRALLWPIVSLPWRLAYTVESGELKVILSMNMTCTAIKP